MQTDKASMLDEIIEYVRFLQLQVKVLSMSRLGGAGAVGPRLNGLTSEVSFLFSYSGLDLRFRKLQYKHFYLNFNFLKKIEVIRPIHNTSLNCYETK